MYVQELCYFKKMKIKHMNKKIFLKKKLKGTLM